MFRRKFYILVGIMGGVLLGTMRSHRTSKIYKKPLLKRKHNLDLGTLKFETVLFNTSSAKNRNVSKHPSVSGRCVKYISLWLGPYGRWPEYSVLEKGFINARNQERGYRDNRIVLSKDFPAVFLECPGFPCDVVLIETRKLENVTVMKHSDALIFNLAPLKNKGRSHKISKKLIKSLPSDIKIVFYSMEGPLILNYFDKNIDKLRYHFDMTYHSSSDIHLPYGRYIVGEPMDKAIINHANNKTDLLVWVASNCKKTFWPRTEWVRNLEKLLTFDTYGKCGKKTCRPRMSPECTRGRLHYKFILALENSPCEEYFTEKLWTNGLMSGIVPIVYGGTRAAYERVAPPNSFIHVGDFSTQQALVDYLLKVDKNDSSYNEFFAWRRQGHIEINYPELQPQAFCKTLPKLLENNGTTVKTVGHSEFFQSCRGGAKRPFVSTGAIQNWTLWN